MTVNKLNKINKENIRTGYIYKITNLINNKSYIGQTTKNVEERWKDHIRKSNNPNGPGYNYPLYSAFRKYGLNNFSFEIIEKCNAESLNDREIYWINHYRTYVLWGDGWGYNQTIGGDSTRKLQLNEQDVIDCYLKNKTLKATAKNFNVSSETIKTILKKHNVKITTLQEHAKAKGHSVIQYDENHNIINEFRTISEVKDYLIKNGLIDPNKNINNKIKYAIIHGTYLCGYYWDSDDFSEEEKEIIKTHEKEVRLNGERKRNKERKVECPICGNLMSHKSTICRECFKKSKRDHIPSRETLIDSILNKTLSEIGNDFNVNYNRVKEWCRIYGLPTSDCRIKEFRKEYFKDKNATLNKYKEPESIIKNTHCKKCGAPVKGNAKLCSSCYNKEKAQHIPNKDILENKLLYFTTTEIARDFNTNLSTIQRWCRKYGLPDTVELIEKFRKEHDGKDGYIWEPRKILKQPSFEELKTNLLEYSIEEIAEKYDATLGTIRNWCKKYNLPYNNQLLKRFREEVSINKNFIWDNSNPELTKPKEKPIKLMNTCKICGKKISPQAEICLECYKKSISKIIPKDELKNKLLYQTPTEISKEFNISRNAVNEWCKKYGLPYQLEELEEFRKDYDGINGYKFISCKIYNKPPKEQLEKELLSYSFEEIAKKYKVIRSTVTKWCRGYNLPANNKALKKFRQYHNSTSKTDEN